MRDDQPVRKIIVKRGHGRGHHGGAWKVAYADFVTTMMALFIVLWIVGQGAAVREAIAKYFRDPGVFDRGGATSLTTHGSGILPNQRAPGGDTEGPDSASRAEEEELQRAAADIRRLLEESGLFGKVREQVKIEVTFEGLRIELAESEASTFFGLGSATVLDEMRPVLENLALVLARLPNHITIEGHTDSRQYSIARNYSNWELSADRANSARRVMEAAGLPPGRIDRVVGFADNLPSVPGDRLDPRNRRITIIVRRSSAVQPGADRAEPAASGAPSGAGPAREEDAGG